jgi:class 3 adenylate cyclase
MMMTDIEDSTGLLHQLGDGYRELIDGVRGILVEAAVRAGGTVVETRADEFFAVFERAAPALDAAVAIQRDLRTRVWPRAATVRVRIGIHTGEPSVNEGNYIGMDVHATARICAVAHGGQIVLSGITRDAAGRETLETVRYRNLGAHRLRGIPDVVPLYQLGAKGLAAKFPPPRVNR